jgi:tetratricopeptide (TPR) repeat protein
MMANSVAQSMRHFHALAAYVLEQTQQNDKSSKLVMSVANHYYAAGKLYANDAVEHLLKAVEACRRLFEYDDALLYLDKVDEVLSFSKKDTIESEILRLLVEADKSNVQGIGAETVAEKLSIYLKTHRSSRDDLKLAATRAAYDAALQNNYSQDWFAKSAQIAKEYLLSSKSTLMQAEGHHFIAICMKPQEENEKKIQLEHFNNAINLTKKDYPAAYAKIANSFAESLSYGDIDSKKQAKELFLDSLRIKENAEIKDLPGMARTYGGLGRLAFFSVPPQIEEAENYFKKDLEIAEEINDLRGISQMNSFLGSCKKETGKFEDAVAYYNKSIEMKNNAFDVHASYEGKLSCLDSMNDNSQLFDTIKRYVKIIDDLGTPPPFMVGKIVAVVEKYAEEDICKELLKKLQQDIKK